MTERYYFRALLSNVDSSILKLRLKHGFKIVQVPEGDAQQFVAEQEHLRPFDAHGKIFMTYHALDLKERCCYFIANSFKAEIDYNSDGSINPTPKNTGPFNRIYVEEYLRPVLQLMRLFQEGNIRIAVRYYFPKRKNSLFGWSRQTSNVVASSELFHIEPSNLPKLNRFLKHTKLPSNNSVMEIAFEQFELSYQIYDVNLALLTLMSGLENLFNLGEGEISYTVSRNTAVLLGTNRDDAQNIYQNMKRLYKSRSEITHKGKPKKRVTHEDVNMLRSYLRECINFLGTLSLQKADWNAKLNAAGFGQKLK